MSRPRHFLFTGLAALALNAQATTLDFEALTRGTVITTQLQAQGVLVSGLDSTGCCHPGTVLDVTLGDLGVLPFGGSGRQALVYGVPTDQLNFNFVLPGTSTPTTWDTVSLRVGDGDGDAETFRVTFKGLAGVVLSSEQFTTGSGPVGGGVTVSYSGIGVNRVEILGIVGFSGGAVDDLSFTNAVPEPAAWALLLAGGAGLALRRRR
jgi:hypothetical protein